MDLEELTREDALNLAIVGQALAFSSRHVEAITSKRKGTTMWVGAPYFLNHASRPNYGREKGVDREGDRKRTASNSYLYYIMFTVYIAPNYSMYDGWLMCCAIHHSPSFRSSRGELLPDSSAGYTFLMRKEETRGQGGKGKRRRTACRPEHPILLVTASMWLFLHP